MAIQQGDALPGTVLLEMGEDGPAQIKLSEATAGKKVVIFGLPGAYTGTCSTAHVPSFMRTIDDLKAKGVDEVFCVSVNDPFVMGAWGKSTGGSDAGIRFLGDADSSFTKAIGLDFSVPPAGLIDRSQRYAMIIEDGKATTVNVEENPGVAEVSTGEAILEAL